MNLLAGVAIFLCEVLLIVVVCLAFHRRGYEKGLQQADIDEEAAYHRGRLDADNWWIRADAEVDQARQKIWREE